MKLSKTTKILLWGANIWYFGEGMLGPLYAIFTEKIGGDILDITWAWSAYLICTGLFYILIGKLVNRKRYKTKLLFVGYLLNAILTFCYLLVDTPLELFYVQIGLGLAEAIGTPVWDALFAASLTKEHDTYAWGLSTGQSQLVSGIAFAVGGVLAYYYSFDLLFIIMGCIQLIAAGVVFQLIENNSEI
jgi:MFS family permease